MLTLAEVVEAPLLSVALAVRVKPPAGTFDQMAEYGLVAAVPIKVVPRKYSTFVTVPLASAAVAVKVMVAGAKKLAPVEGVAIATVGGVLAAALTVIVPVMNGWGLHI